MAAIVGGFLTLFVLGFYVVYASLILNMQIIPQNLMFYCWGTSVIFAFILNFFKAAGEKGMIRF
jgi:hypothetical protein